MLDKNLAGLELSSTALVSARLSRIAIFQPQTLEELWEWPADLYSQDRCSGAYRQYTASGAEAFSKTEHLVYVNFPRNVSKIAAKMGEKTLVEPVQIF
ncbi:MAG: hypothetical protein OSB69_01570 [Alphaproteobacteria bacterium]|nr:hypothetical protein [Alphaproteobacteria bacterium]